MSDIINLLHEGEIDISTDYCDSNQQVLSYPILIIKMISNRGRVRSLSGYEHTSATALRYKSGTFTHDMHCYYSVTNEQCSSSGGEVARYYTSYRSYSSHWYTPFSIT